MSIDNYTNYNLSMNNFGYLWNSNPAVSNNTFVTTPIFNFGVNYVNTTPMNLPFFGYITSFFNTGFNPFQFQLQVMNNFDFGNIFSGIQLPKIETPSNIQTFTYREYTQPKFFGDLTFAAPTGEKAKTSKTTASVSIQTSSNRKETLLKNIEKNDKNFAEQLKEKGVEYDPKLGHSLAEEIIEKAPGTKGHCAKYVNNALEANDINVKRDNHAYTRADVLARDSHFTEVTVTSAEDLKKLPGGSAIVYGKSVCGYNETHGHVAIATGNGSVASDHIQNSIKYPSNGEGIRVFIPTKAIA